MKTNLTIDQQHQEFVFHLIVQEKKSKYEVVSALSNFGIGTTEAKELYEYVSNQLNIFWGAIVFGGYQFLKEYLS
jgi:hypothetical protein